MATTLMQQQAIDFDQGNLLVSASAGSGKTFVMIERVKRLLVEGKANIDEILCVTFTVLAAREMKQKLADKLTKTLEEGGNRAIIERQLDLLPTANISTIHAFCKNLLSEFFYEAGLDPAFQIADDKQCEMLANRAIDRLFEDLYENNSPLLNTLLPHYFVKRSDKNLKKNIQNIYNSLISEANPMKILKDGEYYYSEKSVDEIFESYIVNFKNSSKEIETRAKELKENLSEYKKLDEYVAVLINVLTFIKESKDENELINASLVELPRKPAKPRNCEDSYLIKLDERASEIKDDLSALCKKIREVFENSREEEKLRAQKMLPVYMAVEELVKLYGEYFKKEKAEENSVDYSDLEHLTYKLLQNESIREEVSSRFKYIFTDEYQDTSGVQEGILTALARDNLFMVGDVKQSIYDFRGCNPDIFAEKFDKYQRGEGGSAISLDKNFRSTENVIDAVNNVFKNIMTKECGKVDYNSSQMVYGANYVDEKGTAKLLTIAKNKAENKLPEGIYSVVNHLNCLENNSCFAEGREVAKLITELVGTPYYSIKDNCTKIIDYGDIAILLRAVGNTGDLYANELVKAGIPLSAHSQKSIGDYYEVRLAINILELINCFNQDIPLTAVLKSPVGNISDSELLTIRKNHPRGSFVDAFNSYINEKDDELSVKLKEFKEYFTKIRLVADFTPCDKLLSSIVRDKAIDIKLLSSRLGDEKLARLNRFIQFSGAKGEMVAEFLNGIDEKIQKVTMDFSGENAVQIMSIHASKGLEFPIVIMGGITKRFNDQDSRGDFLIDRRMGVVLNYHDLENKYTYKTIFSKFATDKMKAREREEEMRLLYVAMTRAKNRLYMIGEYQGEKNSKPKDKHGTNDVYLANNYYKMLAKTDMDYTVCDPNKNNFENQEAKQVLIGEKDEYIEGLIDRNLRFEYGFKDSLNLSVKRSVTDVAHFEESEQVAYEKSSIFGNSDSETGTAYHRFLEVCDFYKDAESEFNRLIEGDLMEDEQKKLIEIEKIKKIFAMPVFNLIKDYKLYKEQPFTCFMPGNLIVEDYKGDEEVLVQGVIDLLAVKDNSAIVIDYKHSKVKEDSDLIKRYKKQLELYAYAVEKVLNKKIETTYLVNIYSMKMVEVKIDKFN